MAKFKMHFANRIQVQTYQKKDRLQLYSLFASHEARHALYFTAHRSMRGCSLP